MTFERRAIPRPEASVVLRPSGAPGAAGSDVSDHWELQCRDGWDWRSAGAGLVLVRVATLSGDRALIVQGWLERIKNPAVWWSISRELQSPDSAPDVAQALRSSPWLAEVFPVLLEASTDGSPPQPAAAPARLVERSA